MATSSRLRQRWILGSLVWGWLCAAGGCSDKSAGLGVADGGGSFDAGASGPALDMAARSLSDGSATDAKTAGYDGLPFFDGAFARADAPGDVADSAPSDGLVATDVPGFICTPGELGCLGIDVALCGPDGLWRPGGLSCFPGTCASGRCTGACPKSATGSAPYRGCAGRVPQVCGEDGEWKTEPPCEAACQYGKCRPCELGTGRCAGDMVERCQAEGWSPPTSCGPPGCYNGGCRTCVPGSKMCLSTGPDATVATCAISGTWKGSETCAAGCAAGACSGECKPRQKRCKDDRADVCSETGFWLFSKSCLAGCAETGECSKPSCLPANCAGLRACCETWNPSPAQTYCLSVSSNASPSVCASTLRDLKDCPPICEGTDAGASIDGPDASTASRVAGSCSWGDPQKKGYDSCQNFVGSSFHRPGGTDSFAEGCRMLGRPWRYGPCPVEGTIGACIYQQGTATETASVYSIPNATEEQVRKLREDCTVNLPTKGIWQSPYVPPG